MWREVTALDAMIYKIIIGVNFVSKSLFKPNRPKLYKLGYLSRFLLDSDRVGSELLNCL